MDALAAGGAQSLADAEPVTPPNLREEQRHLPTQLGKGWDQQDHPGLGSGRGSFDTINVITTINSQKRAAQRALHPEDRKFRTSGAMT
eukprot:3050953-Pleurochrysis_carterae.AAC.1